MILVLGWALGIGGTLVVDEWKNRRRKRAFIKSLRVELVKLRFDLSIIIWRLGVKAKSINKEVIQMIQPIIQAYEGPEKSKHLHKICCGMNEINIEKLIEYAESLPSGIEEVVKKRSLLIFGSQMQVLIYLNQKWLTIILAVANRMESINQSIDQHRFYFE